MLDEHKMIEFPTSQRLGTAASGLFLFCFGMPFTLAPFFILPNAFGEGVMLIIFMICFSIPFLLAGLTVQSFGIGAFRMALFPNSKFTQKQLEKTNSNAEEREVSDYYSSSSPSEQRREIMDDQIEKDGNFWDSVKPEGP